MKSTAKTTAKPASSKTAKSSARSTAHGAKASATKVSVRTAVSRAVAPKGSAKAAPAAKAAAKAAKASAAKVSAAKTSKPVVTTSGIDRKTEATVKPAAPKAVLAKPTTGSKMAAPEAKPSAPQAAAPALKAVVKDAEKPVAAKPISETPAPVKAGEPPKPALAQIRPAAPVAPKAKLPQPKHSFKLHEFIVYPAHGVGQIIGVEIQEVAGFSLELFVVSFIKDKMILKVPTSKVLTVGMRKLAETVIVDKALGTLSGRARIKRTMWSRRAQEYESKINSGDLVTIAEVVRDLYRSDTQPEQSYSERQLYEAALDRMAREIAVVKKLIDSEALKLIESFLMKGPRRGPKNDADEGDETDVDRAA